MEFHFAPVQGHTDSSYRNIHHLLFPGITTYYTPFIRLEKGQLRKKDIKELESLNKDFTVPQIIFRHEKELQTLFQLLKERDFKRIDLNMGCPFPLQTARGRGAATIRNLSLVEAVVKLVQENPDIKISVKMRAGMENFNEWEEAVELLNKCNLSHITLHPRVARQQYKDSPNLEVFDNFFAKSKNPVIYNGDVVSFEDIDNIKKRFPGIKGIMIGRGLLIRPSLVTEYLNNEMLSETAQLAETLRMHDMLFDYYSKNLESEQQVFSKIKPFWEYSESFIGRKCWKEFHKSINLTKYKNALTKLRK